MVAPTDSTVLIQGETGTGKELIALQIHKSSRRKDQPLVRVNCATIPKDLYESEFFGHVRGAFTGAIKDRIGRFESAHGGTLFLDEIGEIPIELQSKLLRALQEKQYERVGDERTKRADVRIIAATNRDLKLEVEAGRFREDLYYRLNVFPVQVAPLRERREDIPLLAEHFLAKYSEQMGKTISGLSHEVMDFLTTYDWPGNIRELENVIERAVALETTPSCPTASLIRFEAKVRVPHPRRRRRVCPSQVSISKRTFRRSSVATSRKRSSERAGSR
jgi:transcriptional regulator with GAF, ATPase, and Fis domain